MKNEFYEVYEELYADYLYDYEYRRRQRPRLNEYYLIRLIRRAIDKSDIENKLRPDAKFFLLVNFHQLIVRPFIDKRPFNDLTNDLEDDIQTDISTIISESISLENQKIISGHQIMKTIDKLWKNLRTTKLEIWG